MCGLGQVTFTCVSLSSSSIVWYQPRAVISLAGKVTAGLVESNGSLHTRFMTNVTCGLTDCQERSALNPMRVIEYTLLFYQLEHAVFMCVSAEAASSLAAVIPSSVTKLNGKTRF